MNQPIPNLPQQTMEFCIPVSHRGEKKVGILRITNNEKFNVTFSLDIKSSPLQLNDSFFVYSSSVTWVIY